MIGYIGFSPEKFTLPVTALAIKKSCVLIHTDHVYACGAKVATLPIPQTSLVCVLNVSLMTLVFLCLVVVVHVILCNLFYAVERRKKIKLFAHFLNKLNGIHC